MSTESEINILKDSTIQLNQNLETAVEQLKDAKKSETKNANDSTLGKRDSLDLNLVTKDQSELDDPLPTKILNTEGRLARANTTVSPEKAESEIFGILPENLYNAKGGAIGLKDLSEQVKVFALYFSASYCPPCKKFTPILKEFYDVMNEESKVLEIIFVSKDNSQEEMLGYFEKMPWLSIKFGDAKIANCLEKFCVEGIPQVVVLKNDGTLITKDGKKDVYTKGEVAMDEWLAF
jgi:nucleoredoxin